MSRVSFLILCFFICVSASANTPKIVVLNSDGLEVLRALNAEDTVVGVSEVVKREPQFWKKYTNYPSVGNWRNPDYERIAELHPDYVLCYKKSPGKSAEDKLARLGIKMLRFDFYKISSFENEVSELAKMLGKDAEAEEFLSWWNSLYTKIKEQTSKLKQRPDVYIEGYGFYRSSGPGSGFHEMLTLAGGRNIAEGASIPYLEVEPEWVYSQKPSYIVKMIPDRNCYGNACGSKLAETYQEIKNRQGLRYLEGVKNGNILILSSDMGPGPRSLLGAVSMAKTFHPELFKDIDTASLNAEYLTRFQGLSNSGVYIYPGSLK